MTFKEAQSLRDTVFRKHIAFNLEGNEPLITDVLAVPVDEHLRHGFLSFAESENIIEDAIRMNIPPDDRAYGATGYSQHQDDYTIMLKICHPKENRTEKVLARDYPKIKDLVSEDTLRML